MEQMLHRLYGVDPPDGQPNLKYRPNCYL